jgi:uncharacterized protein (DUF2062 family)
MRKLLRKHLPSHASVVQNHWLKPFSRWLHHHNLWHLHRRSVAGGVAVGMFCGLLPFPLQMIAVVLFAAMLRVNLPVAVISTLYSNPLTILPLYALTFRLGAWVSGTNEGSVQSLFYFPELHWHNWTGDLGNWLATLGKPFLIGLPLMGLILAVAGYVVVRIAWRVAVIMEWRARRRRHLYPSANQRC